MINGKPRFVNGTVESSKRKNLSICFAIGKPKKTNMSGVENRLLAILSKSVVVWLQGKV